MRPIAELQPARKVVPMSSGMVAANRVERGELTAALSRALDMTEGLPAGHNQRTCWIAMSIGRQKRMTDQQLVDLFYATLLKDVGCSSNAARVAALYESDDLKLKADFKQIDSQKIGQMIRFVCSHVAPDAPIIRRLSLLANLAINGQPLYCELIKARCQRGAQIAAAMGMNEAVCAGIANLDEHWNGRGQPVGLRGQDIPLISRIILLAQVAELFWSAAGSAEAIREICRRSTTWFDPSVVMAFLSVSASPRFWQQLDSPDLTATILTMEPADRFYDFGSQGLDQIIEAFVEVIDAKSPDISGHSRRVADIALKIAAQLRMPGDQGRWLRRAALLHDIGKLGVSTRVLAKPPQARTAAENQEYQRHVELGRSIFSGISPFEPLIAMLETHHEQPDGAGYPAKLAGESIPLGGKVIALADAFDHLVGPAGFDAPELSSVLTKLEAQRGSAFDGRCLEALARCVRALKDLPSTGTT